jgi:two-component system OmpR family response regulator
MRHVLVVDDDPSMRDVIGNNLESQNFQVSAVSDGRGMARVLADKAVDLIILDLKLSRCGSGTRSLMAYFLHPSSRPR